MKKEKHDPTRDANANWAADARNQIDYNNIGGLLYFGFILKTLKLMFAIGSLSFFLAMFFRIILTIEHDLNEGDEHYNEDKCEHFAQCYNMFGMNGENSRT